MFAQSQVVEFLACRDGVDTERRGSVELSRPDFGAIGSEGERLWTPHGRRFPEAIEQLSLDVETLFHLSGFIDEEGTFGGSEIGEAGAKRCLLDTSPSPRD